MDRNEGLQARRPVPDTPAWAQPFVAPMENSWFRRARDRLYPNLGLIGARALLGLSPYI